MNEADRDKIVKLYRKRSILYDLRMHLSSVKRSLEEIGYTGNDRGGGAANFAATSVAEAKEIIDQAYELVSADYAGEWSRHPTGEVRGALGMLSASEG